MVVYLHSPTSEHHNHLLLTLFISSDFCDFHVYNFEEFDIAVICACVCAWKSVDGYIMYKWENHFYEMKGDVGMSGHEKERKQEDAYTKIQTHS